MILGSERVRLEDAERTDYAEHRGHHNDGYSFIVDNVDDFRAVTEGVLGFLCT